MQANVHYQNWILDVEGTGPKPQNCALHKIHLKSLRTCTTWHINAPEFCVGWTFKSGFDRPPNQEM